MNESEYYDLKGAKLSKRKVRIITYAIVIFIPLLFLSTLIHELGHIIMARILGYEIGEITLRIFWGSITLDNFDGEDWELVLIYMSGSMFTLIVGILLFVIFYKYRLKPFSELFFSDLSFILILDIIVYNLLDVYFSQYGDWYNIYLIAPYINFLIIIFTLILLALLYKNHKKIINRIQDDELYGE